MSKQKMMHSEALAVAERIIERLRPACERIEIAGSLRRGKAEVGDIELVAIPEPVLDLFGEPTDTTEVDYALGAWGVTFTKNGPKYKQFEIDGVQVDLFLATAENWGLIMMIRTGSGEFSKRMMTPRAWGGLLPAGLRVDGGQVWRDGQPVAAPDETALFSLWGMPYMQPAERA